MFKIESFNPSVSLEMATQGNGHAATGQYGGQSVRIDDATSVLAHAAEEISLHFAEKAETKHSAERKKGPLRSMALMSPEAIGAYLDAAQALDDPNELVHLAGRMLAASENPGELARKAFDGQPTTQFLALQYALQQGQREGADPEVLGALADALEDIEEIHGSAIRADINTMGTASEGTPTRAEIQAFQSTYRDVVLGKNTLAGTLGMALERFGTGEFALGLNRLKEALGRDLAAARPSTDPHRLQSLVQDLYHLGAASALLDNCKNLFAKMGGRNEALFDTPAKLMQDIVKISTEKWVTGSRFSALGTQFGATRPVAQIHFLAGVKKVVAGMPVQLFNDVDQRQRTLEAIQGALDTAVDQEEEGKG